MDDRPRLRITEIRLIHLKTIAEVGALEPAWEPGRNWAFQRSGGSVVEVHTAEGLVGTGPGVDAGLLPALRARLVGQDAFDTEQHLATLRFYATGLPYRSSAGVDIALWDLIGKAC